MHNALNWPSWLAARASSPSAVVKTPEEGLSLAAMLPTGRGTIPALSSNASDIHLLLSPVFRSWDARFASPPRVRARGMTDLLGWRQLMIARAYMTAFEKAGAPGGMAVNAAMTPPPP